MPLETHDHHYSLDVLQSHSRDLEQNNNAHLLRLHQRRQENAVVILLYSCSCSTSLYSLRNSGAVSSTALVFAAAHAPISEEA